MRHILAALDLTPQPGRAFDRAVQLALQHGSELTLAHIVAAGGAAPDDEAETSSADSALARADRKLREYPIPAALKVNFRVAVGNPAREIAALAHEAGAELVVWARIGKTLSRIYSSTPRPITRWSIATRPS